MKPQVKYGLLVGMASLIIFVASTHVQNDRTTLLYYTGVFISAFGIYFAIKDTRDLENGLLKLGRALSIGTLTALIAGCTDGVGRYIYCKFISNSFVITTRNLYMDALENSKAIQSSAEQIAMAKKLVPIVISPGSLSIYDIIGTVFTGFLVSIVIGLLLRKDNTNPPMQDF